MLDNKALTKISAEQLAAIGTNKLAYFRAVHSDDMMRRYPGMQLRPGTQMWALFNADGTPIALSDNRSAVISSAMENELVPVSVH